MTSQARHARPRTPVLPRAVLRAAVAASTVGAALAAGAATAGAEQLPVSPPRTTPQTLSYDLDAPIDLSTPRAGGGSDRSLTDGGTVRNPVRETRTGLRHAAPGAVAPAKNLRLNPVARTGADPLDNSAGTKAADFKPVGTDTVTGPLAKGDSVSRLPHVGPATKVLPG